LSPKTSPSGHRDPTHQDALPTSTQTHPRAVPAHSKALRRTPGDADQQAGLLPAQSSPVQPTAASKMLLLRRTPSEGWLSRCSTGTPRQGTQLGASGLRLQATWVLRHYGQTDRHACQVFPVKVNRTWSLQGGTQRGRDPVCLTVFANTVSPPGSLAPSSRSRVGQAVALLARGDVEGPGGVSALTRGDRSIWSSTGSSDYSVATRSLCTAPAALPPRAAMPCLPIPWPACLCPTRLGDTGIPPHPDTNLHLGHK